MSDVFIDRRLCSSEDALAALIACFPDLDLASRVLRIDTLESRAEDDFDAAVISTPFSRGSVEDEARLPLSITPSTCLRLRLPGKIPPSRSNFGFFRR